jgi:predicted nucleic acid-binding protein
VIAYVDSSVLVRVVLRQPEPLPEFDDIDRALSSRLTEVECLRTLDLLRLRGELSDSEVSAGRAAVLELLARMTILDLGTAVLRRAAEPMPTHLGTLDALHLATALLWRESQDETPTLATHDAALAIAARAHGLPAVGVRLDRS